MGAGDSELRLAAPGAVRLTAKVAAYLTERPAKAPRRAAIPWSIEQARLPETRDVKVEVVVNGRAVAEQTLTADGALRDISFDDVRFDRSSWVALRIFPSSHTNPIFVVVDGKPIRASRRSAEWCLKGVDQCWSQKKKFYAAAEMGDATAAYEHAREAYRRIVAESVAE
jgi:hypothetical protein